MANKVNWSSKKITSFLTNPFISGYLLKSTALMVMPKIIINAFTFCFFDKIQSFLHNNKNWANWTKENCMGTMG